jgi:hypothetical protein
MLTFSANSTECIHNLDILEFHMILHKLTCICYRQTTHRTAVYIFTPNTALHYTTPTKHKVTFHKGQHINNFIACDDNTGNKSQFSSHHKQEKSITSLKTCIHTNTNEHMEAQTHLLTKHMTVKIEVLPTNSLQCYHYMWYTHSVTTNNSGVYYVSRQSSLFNI